ncbi:cytochrome P450 [Dimargaris cristalligena]|uniref:Cytochrome P450 n=1 Tax=Dimargaris cristalligena TaxID=215637 RepID=A0A4V1J4P6_9FUNG|nr:cytochrome P450 [Dimargaris cristalligena]|eukprot:RKP36289.1 cytochrome P450 [Dimargaris cristalligena]
MPNPEYPESLFRKFIGTSLSFSGSDVWRRIRRIVSPAFNHAWPTRAIGETTIRMFDVIEKEEFQRRGGSARMGVVPFDIYLGRLTMDVLGRTAYGFDFNSLENPESKYAVLLATIVRKLCNPVYILFPFLDGLPGFRRDQLSAQIDELDDMLFAVIDQKRQELAETPLKDRANADILTLMIEACQDPTAPRITNKELRDNVVVFYLAGQETTAGALGFWMYMLAQNPRVQTTVRREVLAVMGDAPTDLIPNDGQLKAMVYLDASIRENLRYNPPLPAIVARENMTDQIICGHLIPKGNRIGTHVLALQHHPNHYELPEQFRPERFLDVNMAEPKDGGLAPFIPFGSGPRQCIAKNFSLMEQRVVTSMILRKYTWTLQLDKNGCDPVTSPPFDLNRPENLHLCITKRY